MPISLHAVQLAPIAHPQLDLFLVGYIAAASAVAALFFLRFWKETRDSLFMAFAIFFIVQTALRALALSKNAPNLVAWWENALRLLAVLVVIAAVLRKNARQRG
jgi:uncharacterized membrane protein